LNFTGFKFYGRGKERGVEWGKSEGTQKNGLGGKKE